MSVCAKFQLLDWNSPKSFMKHPYNTLDTVLKLPWNLLEISLNHTWDILKTFHEIPLKHPWDNLKTSLNTHWTPFKTSLEYPWATFVTPLKYLASNVLNAPNLAKRLNPDTRTNGCTLWHRHFLSCSSQLKDKHHSSFIYKLSLSLQSWWWISILNQYQHLGSRRISSPLKILIILYFTWPDITMKQPFLDLVRIQGYESFYLKLFTIWNAIWSCCLAWCLRTCTTLWMNQKISRILFLLQTQAVEGT